MASGQTAQGGVLYALASSSFTRADENPLSEGGAWSTVTTQNPWKIVGNHAEPTDLASTDDGSRYSGVTFPNDQYSRAKLTVNSVGGGGQGIGLTVRVASGAATFYRFIIDHAAATNAEIRRFIAGAGTTLFQWTQPFTDGDQFTMVAEGGLIQVYDKNMRVAASVWDTQIASGSPGIILSTAVTTASLDDWEGGTVVYEVPPVIRRRQARDGMLNELDIAQWFGSRAHQAELALACR